MSRLPIPHIINTIKTKLGFDRAMTAPGEDVVDAVNKQSTTDSALESGLAIVANGDTHAAIASGQYVYVKNHASLAEGLYKANAAIATNGTLSGNVTAASGGLNALKSSIDALNSNVTKKVPYDTVYDITLEAGNNIFYADKINRTLFIEMVFNNAEDIPANSFIGHVVNCPCINRTHWSAVTSTGVFVRLFITYQGQVYTETPIPGNVWISTSVICLINV